MTFSARSIASAALVGIAGMLALHAQGPQAPPYRPTHPIVIVGGLLIDATGAPPRHDQTVVIEGERITSVGPMEQTRIPPGAEVIDAAGMTIMPGLINSNQHIQLNPLYPAPTANLPFANLKARWELNWSRQPQRAFTYLMQGITSLRNTSGPATQILPVKRAIDRGEIPGPRIFLGGALFTSKEHFADYVRQQKTPPDAIEWLRNEFAYAVIEDIDKDTDRFLSEDFTFWKLYMSGEPWNGRNDFTDDQLRFIIAKAHKHGKKVDVHCGGHNAGLRRMTAFDVDTLEHPFLRSELVDADTIDAYVRKGVMVDTLLIQVISVPLRAADPHRFDETLYAMTLDPREHRILMQYRDRLLANLKKPDERGVAVYDPAAPADFPELAGTPPLSGTGSPPFAQLVQQLRTSKENMRRFIKAGAKFSLGTDANAFLNLQQEDPNAHEMMLMVEMGLTPMDAIIASTRNGAEMLGMLKDLGTIETGKLADVIVVAGNPLQNMAAMTRVAYVIKGGVRYK